MRILLVLFLSVFVLAAASPLYDVVQVGVLEDLADDIDLFSDGKPFLEEVKEKLNEKFREFQQKVKEALQSGNDKDKILDKYREIREEFTFLIGNLERYGKAFLEKLIGHGRDYLSELFKKAGLNDKRAVDYHVDAIMAAEDKENLLNKLKEVVKKIKDAIEQGKSLKDGLTMLEKIRQKLKDFNIDLGDIGNEYLDQLKDKLKDYWQKLKDRLGVSKRGANLDVFAMLNEFKQLINEELNPAKIKAFIEKYVGENQELTDDLTQLIKENGKDDREKIHAFLKKIIHQMIGTYSEPKSDVFEEIRDFFKDLGIEIRDRFKKFGEWMKEQYEKGLEKSKNRLENIKTITKESTKKISKNVAEEALKFFKKYREDLGNVLDDIENQVKEVLKQD